MRVLGSIVGGCFLALSVSLILIGQSLSKYRHEGKVLLPNLELSPGVVRTTDEREICNPRFRTGPYRNTTKAMKRQVYLEYGVQRGVGVLKGGYEIDHVIPLELGGLDTVKNLWPQPAYPAPGFHQKDDLENILQRKVCREHSMTLPEAQACIISNWVSCWKKVR